MKQPIIVHIPKTGGTTLISNLLNINWQPKPNYNYRHILFDSLQSNSNDIFNPIFKDKYSLEKIIIFIRDPFERCISEYNFLKTRPKFFDEFEKKPTSLHEYIFNEQTHNPITKFLYGVKLYSKVDSINIENMYNTIMKSLEYLNIIVGVTEEYNTSLNIIEKKTKTHIKKNIQLKRETIYKEKIENYDELKILYIKTNEFDYLLYKKLLNIFEQEKQKLKKIKQFVFKSDQFDYIFQYTNNKCILEAFSGDEDFIKTFKNELQIIHLNVLQDIPKQDGKIYLIKWIQLCIQKFHLKIEIDLNNPVNTMEKLCKVLKLCVFIHIPKTAGSTFVNLLSESMTNTSHVKNDSTHRVNNILHIFVQHLNFYGNRLSQCHTYFDIKSSFYKNKHIFMLVRHPVDRIVSEYIFQKYILKSNSAAILSILPSKPDTFFDYIKCNEVWNYQVGFLTGRGVASERKSTIDDLQSVISTCKKYNITIGITSEFDNFVKQFVNVTSIQLKDNICTMKKAPPQIKTDILNDITPEVYNYIIETNDLDMQLYNFANQITQ